MEFVRESFQHIEVTFYFLQINFLYIDDDIISRYNI